MAGFCIKQVRNNNFVVTESCIIHGIGTDLIKKVLHSNKWWVARLAKTVTLAENVTRSTFTLLSRVNNFHCLLEKSESCENFLRSGFAFNVLMRKTISPNYSTKPLINSKNYSRRVKDFSWFWDSLSSSSGKALWEFLSNFIFRSPGMQNFKIPGNFLPSGFIVLLALARN